CNTMRLRLFTGKHFIFVCLAIWSLALIYMSNQRFEAPAEDEKSFSWTLKDLRERINDLKLQSDKIVLFSDQLKPMYEELLRLRHSALSSQLPASSIGGQFATASRNGDSMAAPRLDWGHERLRRRVQDGIREVRFMLNGQLAKLRKELSEKRPSASEIDGRLEGLAESVNEIIRLVGVEGEALAEAGGAADWRRRRLSRLQTELVNRIVKLQNPQQCQSAKKLICNLNKGCGFGCQAHHVLYCMTLAYATGRTFVLDSVNWRYSRGGWTSVFEPLSKTCTERGSAGAKQWGSTGAEDAQLVEVPIIDAMAHKPPYLPQAIPADLYEELSGLHGNPFVWFAGVLLNYIMRPNAAFQRQLDDNAIRLGFAKPIVGVQVRRTDKIGSEAAFHDISEYMVWVEEFYKTYELRHGRPDKMRVLLATDDANLLNEAARRYPAYTFLSDTSSSRSASVRDRYSDGGLRGVISDVLLLSKTDYLVCTFSSQVCRLAYELMQVGRDDSSDRFHSLDDVYYFGGQLPLEVTARFAHKARDSSELDLSPGDVIGLAGNHWDGYSLGQSRRLGRNGLFPAYKTELVVRKAEMRPGL
ncbi:hypothetical protein BOX15_Mlig000795g1, partial [Macrostomum lignano]